MPSPNLADMPPMSYASLFSGIEGIGLGLERVGMTPAFQVEINPAPRSVLARRWPDVHQFTDVREVTVHDTRTCPDPGADPVCSTCGGVRRVDVLTGGFPCQDLSVAGSRRGLAGPRSGLWWHFARLVAGLAPTWCIIENVPGLLSSNDGRDMGTIVGTLGDLGYGVAYRVLDAQWFGVAQRRERVVIVGCAGDWTGPAAVLLEPETGGGHPPTVDEKEARAALRAGRRPRTGRRRHRGGTPEVLADDGIISALTGGLGSGGPDAAHAHAGWYIAEEVSGPVLAQGTDGRGWRLEPDGQGLVVDVSPTVTAKWRKGTGGPSGDECQNMVVEAVPIAERGRDGDTALEMGEEGDPYNCLRAGDGSSSRQPLVGVFRKVRRAGDDQDAETWAEDDVANTLNLNDTSGARTTQAIVEAIPVDVRNASRTGGEGVGTPGVGIGVDGDPAYTVTTNPQAQAVAYAIPVQDGRGIDKGQNGLGVGEEGSPAYTLDTLGAQAIAYSVVPERGQGTDLVLAETEVAGTLTVNNLGPTSGDRQPLLLDSVELVVRRLMPVECLRLQGFPDDWCGEHTPEWTRPDGLSDSAVYAAAGNAVAVPVFHWTGRRLRDVHHRLGLDGFRHTPQPFTMPELLPDEEPVEDLEPATLF